LLAGSQIRIDAVLLTRNGLRNRQCSENYFRGWQHSHPDQRRIYRPLEVYTIVALIYFAILFPATLVARRLERGMTYDKA
jgi:hypothetical protein